jgi:hypothetical protein
MLTDVIAIIDVMQVFSRSFVLIGTVLAYLAYFPPLTLQEKLGIQKYGDETYYFGGTDKELDVLAKENSV